MGKGNVDVWDLNSDSFLDPGHWGALEDMIQSNGAKILLEGGLGQNKDGVLVLTIGFQRHSNGGKVVSFVDGEFSDNFESVNIDRSSWSHKLSLSNIQEFLLEVVLIVERVENYTAGGFLVQKWS